MPTHRKQSPIFDMMSFVQDGGHSVISSTKVLPSGKSTRSVCMPGAYAAAFASS